MAVIVATLPDSYCPLVGDTVPPSIGFAVAVKVNNTGSSTSLLQERRMKTNKKEEFILLCR